MFRQVTAIFIPPIFPEDEDKTRKARYAHWIAVFFFGVVILFETIVRPLTHYTGFGVMDILLLGIAGISVTGLVRLRQGHVRSTSIMLVILVWVASNGIAATGFGAKDASYILNFAIILMAGLLLGWRASLIITALSILSGVALAYLEQFGQIGAGPYPITFFVRDISIVLGLNAGIIWLLIGGLETALKKSRLSLEELASANTTLSYTQNELQNRSSELIIANKQLESRTQKLHAIAMVTRTAASIQDFESLLSSITGTISKELGYYHVGLFLLDEQKEFAILRSTNTEAGLRVLNRGYRVPIGQINPIGFVAQTGQPRIVPLGSAVQNSDTNSELPESHAEMVLPLKSGDQIIGVLDIHAKESDAFHQEDIPTLSILADQVAITIQNSFLHEQSLRALRKAELESMQAATQAWQQYEKSIQTKGYYYDGIKSEPLQNEKQAGKGNNSLLIPIELRGQTIGRFRLNLSDPTRTWTDDELVMVKAAAERVALALEGARLLEEAQKRAAREAFLSEVATKLSTSFQLDSILRDTVQELGQTLKNSTVTFQLVNPATSPDGMEQKRSNGVITE